MGCTVNPSDLFKDWSARLKNLTIDERTQLDDILTSLSEKGLSITDESTENLARSFIKIVYKNVDARTPKGVTGYPVYKNGDLILPNALATIYFDPTYDAEAHDKVRDIYKLLGFGENYEDGMPIENRFTPIIPKSNNFSKSDFNFISTALTRVYFDIRKRGMNQRLSVKDNIINAFKESIEVERSKSEVVKYKYKEDFVKSVYEDLEDINSVLYSHFVKYVKRNFGVDIQKYDDDISEILNVDTEEGQISAEEGVQNVWDDVQKDRIDRKKSLSSHVKILLQEELNGADFGRSGETKLYITPPVDINNIWNKLVSTFKYCVEFKDYHRRVTELASVYPSFVKIKEKFDIAAEQENLLNNDNPSEFVSPEVSFVNSLMNGVGLAITPSKEFNIDQNKIYNQNQYAFAEDVYFDRFIDIIEYSKDSGLYADLSGRFNDLTKPLLSKITPKSDLTDTKKAILNVLKYLRLPVSENAINQFYSSNEEYKAVSKLSYLLVQILKGLNSTGKIDVYGYLSDLANIASYDFNSYTKQSFSDVHNQLNYTPQYNSMITKFFRGFRTQTDVNTTYIQNVFADYLNDPTMKGDNILFYDEKSGIGIFNPNGSVNSNFKADVLNGKQFNISTFNGIRLARTSKKYREMQGVLYNYTEIALQMLGYYIILTSDSSRSYMISIKRYSIDDLFINNDINKLNRESGIYQAISNILDSDINKVLTFAPHVLTLEDNESGHAKMRTRHNVKYWNGRRIFDSNGVPTGRVFKFTNLTYKTPDGRDINYATFVANKLNISTEEFYQRLVNDARTKSDDNNNMRSDLFDNDYRKEFINAWISNTIINETQALKDVIPNLLNIEVEVEGEFKNPFVQALSEDIEDIVKAKSKEWKKEHPNINLSDDTILKFRNEALSELSQSPDLWKNNNIRRELARVILNNTIYTHSLHALFAGDQEEYKNSTDLNKRIAQIIKNGFSATSVRKTKRKVLVIDDMEYQSTVFDKLFEGDLAIKSKFVRKAYEKKATINDSMSIITDEGLIKLLESTGRWDENSGLVKLIKDLRNPNKPIDWTSYDKLCEQLKLFGTCRRKRSDFYKQPAVEDGNDPFSNEVDTVQIKDSTIVLFEATTRGTALGDLYDQMTKLGIDQISPISAVKVSGITPLKIDEEGRLNLNALQKSLIPHTLEMNQDDFVIQQDIPADILDEETIVGTQLVKQIVTNLNWNEAVYELDDKKYTGEEIFKEFNSLLVSNLKEDANTLLYELGIADKSGNINSEQIDIVKLITKLRKLISSSNGSEIIDEALEIQEDGQPLLSLSYPVIKNKIESTIASLFTKRVIDQKLPGAHVPIVSDLWWYGNDTINFNVEFTKDEIEKHSDDPQWVQNQINEHADRVMLELANSSITYSEEFINSRIEEFKNSRTEIDGKVVYKLDFRLRADYHKSKDSKDYEYAEVILNPWMLEFYDRIITTKTITYADGRTIDLQVVDINKISEDARKMFGIRIPTEGKQSMVTFKVVGFMNTGTSQAIFPASMITRTGWDFDIDSIYIYLRNLEFRDDIYQPIKFKDEQTFLNKRRFKDPAYKDIIFKSLSFDEINGFIKYIPYLIKNGQLIEGDFDTLLKNTPNKKVSEFKIKTLESLRLELRRLFVEVSNLNIKDIFNDKNNITLNDPQSNYNTVINIVFKMYLITNRLSYLYGDIFNNIVKYLSDVNQLIDDTTSSDITDNIATIFTPYYAFQDYIDNKYTNYKHNLYMNKYISRDARENRIIDIFESIHSSFEHREEVNKANDMDELSETSKFYNALWGQDINGLNPNNLSDKMTLNNMSMSSTVIKGYSVNMDTNLAVLGTINAKLANPIIQVLDFDELPQPSEFTSREEMYTKEGNEYKFTDNYKKWLEDIVGSEVKIDNRRKVVIIQDRYINNDALNSHRDISGENIGLQMNQWTSGILDVLKAQLIFTLDVKTLSVLRMITAGTVIRNDNTTKVKGNNRFIHSIAFISQPAIVRALQKHSQAILNNKIYKFETAIIDTRREYNKQLIELYFDTIREDSVKEKIKSHSKLEKVIESNYSKLPKYIVDELCGFFKTHIKSITGSNGYLTVKELTNIIADRNTIDANHIISQIAVLNQFEEVNSITEDVVAFGFLTKTESDVNSFHSADIKKLNIADYFYPLALMEEDIQDRYNKTLAHVNRFEKHDDKIYNDFIDLSSAEFNTEYQITDENGKVVKAITIKDLNQFKNDLLDATDVLKRERICKDYSIDISAKNQILLPDNKDAVLEIFSQSNKGYNTDNKLTNSVEKSIYPIIEARYAFSHALVSQLFDNIFIQQNPLLRSILIGKLLSRSNYINENTIKRLSDYVTTIAISLLGKTQVDSITNDAFITSSHKDTVLRIIGSEIDHNEQNNILKNLSTYSIKDGFTKEAFKLFTKLSIGNQIKYLQSNPTLRDYIEKSPEFNNSNIIQFLKVGKRKNGIDNVRVNIDDSNPVLVSDVSNSINLMWDSNNPFIAHTIRNLIVYTYITQGFTFAYNISKYISPSLLAVERPNEIYNKWIEDLEDYVDPTKNIHNYRNNIFTAESNFKKSVGKELIERILNIISQIDTSINPIMPKLEDKIWLWENAPNKANIGYIDSSYIEGGNKTNLASVKYEDASGKIRQCFLEIEARIINSDYANANYIVSRNKGVEQIYKKEPIKVLNPNDPFSTIIAYVPTQPMMKNEIAISSTYSSTSQVANDLWKVKSGDTIIDLITYLRTDSTLNKQYDALLEAYKQARKSNKFESVELKNGKPISEQPKDEPENVTQTEPDPSFEPVGFSNEDEENVDEAPFAEVLYTTPISDIKFESKPVFNIIDDLTNNSDNQIYITTDSVSNIIKNKHSNAIQVDYLKSPYEEALRISKNLKPGKLYINGDDYAYFKDSNDNIRRWTSEFIHNLNIINPQYSKLTTLVKDNIGAYVAYTYVPYDCENISIAKDETELYNTVIVVDKSNTEINRKFENNADIAVDILNLTKKVQTLLQKHNLSGDNELINLLKKFEHLDYEEGIIKALEVFDKTAINDAYAGITDIAVTIYNVIEKLYNQLKAIDYGVIRDNYSAVQEYKSKLSNLRKLISYFETYTKISTFDIDDTSYKSDVEEDVKAFNEEFGLINDNIRKLKYFTDRVIEKASFVTNATKEIIAYQVLARSRNPKYVTEFFKIKELLHKYNGDLTQVEESEISISKDEWDKLIHILFTFDGKDITRIQKWLDSSFVTGIDIIDNLGKSWDEANRKNVRKRQSIMARLEYALEDLQKGLSENAKLREQYMHKFITEEGDLIDTYNTNPYKQIAILQYIIQSEIAKIEEDITLSDEEKSKKLYEKVQTLINSTTDDGKFKLIRLSEEEEAKHFNKLAKLSYRDAVIYKRNNNIEIINQPVDIADTRRGVIYKIEYTDKAMSNTFKALSDKEKAFIVELKKLIQEVIHDYDPQWISYTANSYDAVMPYLPQATMAGAIKSFVSIPSIKIDDKYTDIDGKKYYVLHAKSLEIPKHHPVYKMPKQREGELGNNYAERVLNNFKEWFEKNNKIEGIKPEFKTLKDIHDYSSKVLKENKKWKAQTMSYDIVDVMKSFTFELYNNKAIKDFTLDHALVDYLFDVPVNNVSPRQIMNNTATQLQNMMDRIVGASKHQGFADVAAGALLRFTSMSFMYFNYSAGIVNIFKGITDMIVESTDFGFVDSKSLRSGLSDMMKLIPSYLKDLKSARTDNLNVAILKDFDDIYQDTSDVNASLTGTGFMVKSLELINRLGYSFNGMGEFIMQFGMLLAATHSHRVVKFGKHTRVFSFQDYFNDNLETTLLEIMTPEQTDKYKAFKAEYNDRLKKRQNKVKYKIQFDGNYVTPFLAENVDLLTKEQKQKLKDSRKNDLKSQREAFEKLPTLNSQLELKNGVLSYKEDSGLTDEAMAEFKARVKAINQSLHGIYNRVDRMALQDYALTDLIMQFKKWIRPNLIRMIGRVAGNIFYNEQLGGYEVPIVKAWYDMIETSKQAWRNTLKEQNNFMDYAKALGNFLSVSLRFLRNINFYYNTLPIYEQASALKFAKFIGSVCFAIIVIIAAGSLKDDDDWATQNLAYVGTSYYSQIVEQVPIFGWSRMVSQSLDSLFAGQTILENAIKLTNLTVQSLWVADDEMIYDRGIYKGQDKRKVTLMKLLPITRQINKAMNIGSTMTYYNQYDPFGLKFEAIRNTIRTFKEGNTSDDDWISWDND